MRALLLAWRARGGLADPFQFAPQGLLPGGFLFLFIGQARLLLLQPGGVVAFPGNALAAVEFQDPAGDVVQEIAIVRHGDDGAFVSPQVLLQPFHRFGIEVVRRLIENQDVRLLKQQAAQADTATLAAGEDVHGCVAGGTAQGIHGHLKLRVEVPQALAVDLLLEFALLLQEFVHLVIVHRLGELVADGVEVVDQFHLDAHPLFDDLAHGLAVLQMRLLLQVADRMAGRQGNLPLKLLVHARQDLEQGTLARAVEPQHADLGAVEIGEVDVLEDDLLVVGFADADHRVDDLVRFIAHNFGDLLETGPGRHGGRDS